MKFRIALLCLAAAAGAGCAGDNTTSLSATEQPSRATASTTPYKQLPDPDLANNSDRSTSLGRLCWVNLELNDHLVALALAANEVATKTEANAARSAAEFREFASNIDQLLGSEDGLPDTARQFRTELSKAGARITNILASADTSTADGRTEAYAAVAKELNWTDFPGIDGYVKAAEADTRSCPFARTTSG